MLISGLRYQVKEIEQRDFEVTNKGMMEAYLAGDLEYPWKRWVSEFYVKVRRSDEDWDRVLVFSKSDFKQLFPTFKIKKPEDYQSPGKPK